MGTTSQASISETEEPAWGLLCSNKPVVILFQFGLNWRTTLAEEPIIGDRGRKPINNKKNLNTDHKLDII